MKQNNNQMRFFLQKKNSAILGLVAFLICIALILTAFPEITVRAVGQNAMWFMDCVYFSQLPGGGYSHQGTMNFDVIGLHEHTDVFAPFDCQIVDIKLGYNYGNTVIIESVDKVNYADGSYDYMSLSFSHDEDVSNLWIGKQIKQGEVFYQTGQYGNVTGDHTHVSCIRGKYQWDLYTQNQYGRYGSPNAINPVDALFISPSTNVVSTMGLNFKTYPSAVIFFNVWVEGIAETSAHIYANFTKGLYNDVGFYIGTSTSNMRKHSEKEKNPTLLTTDWAGYELSVWGEPLSPATQYYYRFYVTSDKEYQSDIKSFTTVCTHKNLTRHARNEASHFNAGNIEYWACNACGKYFSDANGKNEITQQQTVIAQKDHSYAQTWSKNGSQHWHECSCGDKIDVENHVYDNDCDTTCNKCSATRTITHSYELIWSKDGTQHWHECSVCFDKTDIGNHIYDNDTDTTCNVCGYVRNIEKPIDENDPQIVIGKETVHAGDTVQLKILLKNADTLKTVALSDISYDTETLELISGEWKIDNSILSNVDVAKKTAVIGFGDNTGCNGTLFVLTFKVKDNAEDGYYPISCSITAKRKEAAGEQSYSVASVAGGITVTSIMTGDVNGDDDVNSDDAIYLLYYTLLPDMYPINQDGDFDGNGEVNSDDAIYLLYYTLLPDLYPLN